jgi:CO/xanthine dehydrogenase Mo-binding subunit
MALECAMVELAERLDLDPVELRLRNDTQIDQTPGSMRLAAVAPLRTASTAHTKREEAGARSVLATPRFCARAGK